jgi:hypothetical protein
MKQPTPPSLPALFWVMAEDLPMASMVIYTRTDGRDRDLRSRSEAIVGSVHYFKNNKQQG